ncbi:NAD(P)/FAD-dependent oxidoreductase [Croceicoccus bisphenolivorans]|uniref:NAD(P)/FAD-dependent oxidoreductase n=1 Tax=Croceicoccus bisphenolivorans TaxID=1783232 RepID=UPI000829A3BD|nr:FAD-dependent monooxygenase [Croceicoccus bisphenolivorans]
MKNTPPIVIGGGPAGAAAAILLGRAGAYPVVYERRESVGDALCGGFLSWTTLRRLGELGVSGEALGGHIVHTLRLTAGQQAWRMALPESGMGVSRLRLDSMLLARAEGVGAEIRRATVRYEDGTFQLPDGQAIEADSIFLATGKHDMRGLPRSRAAAKGDPFLGLRMRFAAKPELREQLSGAIEMHLFPKGYAGLVLHEGGFANLCMAVRKSRLAQAGGSPERLLAQLAEGDTPLARRIAALPTQECMDAIGHVPYGWRAVETQPGLFRLGDQAGVIPSLAGEGIGIALVSARLATDAWISDGPVAAEAFQRAFAARLRSRLAFAGAISGIATSRHVAPLFGIVASIPGLARLMGNLTRI